MRVFILLVAAFFISNAVKAVGDTAPLDIMGELYLLSFLIGWVLFSGDRDVKTLIRLAIGGYWGILIHLLIFEKASGGAFIFQVGSFLAMSAFLSYAFTGYNTNELIGLIKEKRSLHKQKWEQHHAIAPETDEIPIEDENDTLIIKIDEDIESDQSLPAVSN